MTDTVPFQGHYLGHCSTSKDLALMLSRKAMSGNYEIFIHTIGHSFYFCQHEGESFAEFLLICANKIFTDDKLRLPQGCWQAYELRYVANEGVMIFYVIPYFKSAIHSVSATTSEC